MVLIKWRHESLRKNRERERETDIEKYREEREINNRQIKEGRKRKSERMGRVREKCEAVILKMEEATSQGMSVAYRRLKKTRKQILP